MSLGLDKVVRRKKLAKVSEVVEEVDVRLGSGVNVKSNVSQVLASLGVDPQLERETTPFKSSLETLL